jgi:hypothetical protein
MTSATAPSRGNGALSGADPTDLLREAVATAIRVGAALEELIHQPTSRPGGPRSVLVGSAPSWHAQAAYLVLDLQHLARRLEGELRFKVTDAYRQPRGGSDANTTLALSALVDMAQAVDRDTRWDVWRRLDAWCLKGRTCLGEFEPLQLLPRKPGKREPRCPYCSRLTLRQQVLAGLVRCVNPACRDDSGHRPVARVTLGRLSAQPILTWRDGTSGVPEGESLDAVAA